MAKLRFPADMTWLETLYQLLLGLNADRPFPDSFLFFPPFVTSRLVDSVPDWLREDEDFLVAEATSLFHKRQFKAALERTERLLGRETLAPRRFLRVRPLSPSSLSFSSLQIHVACLSALGKAPELFRLAHHLINKGKEKGPSLVLLFFSSSCSFSGDIDPFVWYAIGSYYLLVGKFSAARQYLAKCTVSGAEGADVGPFQPSSSSPLILIRSCLVRARTLLCSRRSPSFPFSALTLSGEHDQALTAYRTSHALLPGALLPPLALATQLTQLFNFHLSASYLRQAEVLSPEEPLVHHEHGVLAYTQKEVVIPPPLPPQLTPSSTRPRSPTLSAPWPSLNRPGGLIVSGPRPFSTSVMLSAN